MPNLQNSLLPTKSASVLLITLARNNLINQELVVKGKSNLFEAFINLEPKNVINQLFINQ